jgi:site-specific recombinase XerD
VIGKGNKEGIAPFGIKTEALLHRWLETPNGSSTLWNIKAQGIKSMLTMLKKRTGLPCNAHTFRRSFATILAKRWESNRQIAEQILRLIIDSKDRIGG